MSFRNIYYSNKLEAIQLWTWDEDGKRIETCTSFEPFLYIETDQVTNFKSIYNTNLKKLTFKNSFERNKFISTTNIKRIFHCLPPEQQFLLETFKNGIETKHPLRIFYLDIETYATDGKFSKPEDATDPINLITIYDTLTEKFYSWGLKKSFKSTTNVEYKSFQNEEDLLESFLDFWSNNYPDYVSGWNCVGYDIPFIINRLKRLFDDDKPCDLSPVKKIWLKPEASVNLKGQKKDRWIIYGLSILDYMDVYQTFSLGDRESYALNYIAQYELKEEKIAYNQVSLSDLADQDWEKFVEYNIQDVNLLVKLEEKLKYLKLIQNLSYKGFVQPEKALGKVSLITGAVAHQAMLENLLIPTFIGDAEIRRFEGGFVKEPVPKIYSNVISYDANSLYPNTIITLNISPETKIGKIVYKNDTSVSLLLSNGKNVLLDNEKFSKLIQKEKLSISKANVLYSQKFKGIIPKFVDNLYDQRLNAKNHANDLKKKLSIETEPEKILEYEKKIVDYEVLSNVYKVVLNSTYGIFAQKFSPLFDIDHAESITLTGQETNKNGARVIFEKAKSDGFLGDLDDIWVYGDTDSCFFDFTKILEKRGITLLKNNQVSNDAIKIINEYSDHLNKEIQKWAKQDLFSIDPRYFFKREKICDSALLHKKKHYILHVLDDEDFPCNKFVYKGIEVVKSTMSKDVKDLIKNVIEQSIIVKDLKKSNELFFKSYEKFCNFNEEQISTRKKINDYEKGINSYINGKYGKGTPDHVKAAINYNILLQNFKIDNKYVKINSGNKIKYFYTAKNKFGYSNLGFVEQFPIEFKELIKPDYKKQFEKTVAPIIQRVYTIIGWSLPTIGQEPVVDLWDFLS
jgi:DNA polymerase elongation subunit (family B)